MSGTRRRSSVFGRQLRSPIRRDEARTDVVCLEQRTQKLRIRWIGPQFAALDELRELHKFLVDGSAPAELLLPAHHKSVDVVDFAAPALCQS